MAKGTVQGVQGASSSDEIRNPSFQRVQYSRGDLNPNPSSLAACGGLTVSSPRSASISFANIDKDDCPVEYPPVASKERIAQYTYRQYYGTLDGDSSVRGLNPILGHEYLFPANATDIPKLVPVVVLVREEFEARGLADRHTSNTGHVSNGIKNVPASKDPMTTRAHSLKRTRSLGTAQDKTHKKQAVNTSPNQFFIGDAASLEAFYEYHLEEIGMTVCKKLACMWIAVRWPKRSRGYPYLRKIRNTAPPKYDEPPGYNGLVPGWPANDVIYTEPAHLPSSQVKRLLIFFFRAHRECDERGRRGDKHSWISDLELAANSYVELGFNLSKDYSTSKDITFQDRKEERTKGCIYSCYGAAKSEEDFYAAHALYGVEDTNCPDTYPGKTITWSRKERIPRLRCPNQSSSTSKTKRQRWTEKITQKQVIDLTVSNDDSQGGEESTESQETQDETPAASPQRPHSPPSMPSPDQEQSPCTAQSPMGTTGSNEPSMCTPVPQQQQPPHRPPVVQSLDIGSLVVDNLGLSVPELPVDTSGTAQSSLFALNSPEPSPTLSVVQLHAVNPPLSCKRELNIPQLHMGTTTPGNLSSFPMTSQHSLGLMVPPLVQPRVGDRQDCWQGMHSHMRINSLASSLDQPPCPTFMSQTKDFEGIYNMPTPSINGQQIYRVADHHQRPGTQLMDTSTTPWGFSAHHTGMPYLSGYTTEELEYPNISNNVSSLSNLYPVRYHSTPSPLAQYQLARPEDLRDVKNFTYPKSGVPNLSSTG